MLKVIGDFELIDPRELTTVIENTQEMTARAIKVDFQTTTKTWNTKVDFKIEQVGAFEKLIYTDNDIYGFVNYGTKPHPIEPVNSSTLVFQWGGPGSTLPPSLFPQGVPSSKAGLSGPAGSVTTLAPHQRVPCALAGG